MSKAIVFVASGLLALLGLAVVASQMTGQPSDAIRGMGLLLFSFGVLLAALGVYSRSRQPAQALAQAQGLETQGSVVKKKTDRVCSVCNRYRAEVFCRVHIARLCPGCMNTHDDGKNCLYVPATRASAAYK